MEKIVTNYHNMQSNSGVENFGLFIDIIHTIPYRVTGGELLFSATGFPAPKLEERCYGFFKTDSIIPYSRACLKFDKPTGVFVPKKSIVDCLLEDNDSAEHSHAMQMIINGLLRGGIPHELLITIDGYESFEMFRGRHFLNNYLLGTGYTICTGHLIGEERRPPIKFCILDKLFRSVELYPAKTDDAPETTAAWFNRLKSQYDIGCGHKNESL